MYPPSVDASAPPTPVQPYWGASFPQPTGPGGVAAAEHSPPGCFSPSVMGPVEAAPEYRVIVDANNLTVEIENELSE